MPTQAVHLTVLAGLILIVFAVNGIIESYLPRTQRPGENSLTKSILFTCVGLGALYAPIKLMDGVSLDAGSAILACATLLTGWFVGLITAMTMLIYRLVASGGAGNWIHALDVALNYMVLLVLIQPVLTRFLPPQSYRLLLTGALAMAILEPLWLLLISTPERGDQLLRDVGPILALFQFITTLVLGALLKTQNDRIRLVAELRTRNVAFDNTQEGIVVTDAQGRIKAFNRAFIPIAGWPERVIIGQTFDRLLSERYEPAFFHTLWSDLTQNGGWRGEVWNRRRDGENYPVWLTLSAVRNEVGDLSQCVGVFTDITPIKNYQEQLEHQAHHDPLTGLANRLLLSARLEHALQVAVRDSGILAVLFIDLDRFKRVNDSLGHSLGDALLLAITKRFQDAIRTDDTLARLAGDEFVVLAERLQSWEEAEWLARQLIGSLASPIRLGSQVLHMSASIGISLYPRDGKSADTLIQYADAAMYRAKDQGRNNYQFYSSEITAAALERITLEDQLRKALANDLLLLQYQPQVDLGSSRLVGVEALLRLRKSDGNLMSPERLITIAEESGLIVDLGHWVLREACRQGRVWLDQGLVIDRVAVNVSARQIQQGELLTQVDAILVETGLPAECLELEVTETLLMEQPLEVSALLDRLRDRGIMISIDDFGTGYSSLARLKHLPADKIKIDKSFVRRLPDDENDAVITRSIIALGKTMRFTVLAEGVETEAQRDFLLAEGCDQAQGYWFGRPVDAEELTRRWQATHGTGQSFHPVERYDDQGHVRVRKAEPASAQCLRRP